MIVSEGVFYAMIGAALALGVPAIATAIGLGAAGVSAAAAVSENKENFKNSLILQSLPQTQTIYGFITALLIVIGVGLLGSSGKEITKEQGYVMLATGAIVALTGLSAIFQGKVASAGIAGTAKNSSAFVPSLVFAGQVETPAIFGFITALIVLVVGLGVLG
ncbi:MAG: V-type ATP synthase subunit K [Candidatus Diapherotrites archaeon]|nr:V-type ATP synthase subunit K [Candidatus Diapherotrites archaeon]